MGEIPEIGITLRGVARSGFPRNALRGRLQDNRQGQKEGNWQGTARQDARRPWSRQGRLLVNDTW